MAAANEKMTDKELLNLYKQRLLRQQFMEYLLKQVAEVTYQYNCFENSSLMAFATVRSRQSIVADITFLSVKLFYRLFY